MFTRVPVPQGVARKLQTMILEGELTAGEKIPSQRALSERFGVSRASLREALMTLETIGLVKTEAGRGTFVVGASPAGDKTMSAWRYSDTYSLQEVFETRLMLEAHAAGLSAGRLSADTLAELGRLTDEMERAWAERDYLANVEADLRFHGLISAGCGNAMIAGLYLQVREQLTETQRQPIPITDPDRMRASLAEHRQLIDALRHGRAVDARAAMRAHIANTAACAGFTLDGLG